jgi:hypothetical protein
MPSVGPLGNGNWRKWIPGAYVCARTDAIKGKPAALRGKRITTLQSQRRSLLKHNISGVNDAIERTPIASKADALAALDLIRDETIQPGHHLVGSMVAALRR